MSSLTTHCTTLETTLNAQSIALAENMFNFEKTPSSKIDSSYNYLVSKDWLSDEGSGNTWSTATFDIEVTYTVNQGKFTNTIEKAKVTLAETYESALYTAFCSYAITFSWSFDENEISNSVVKLLMTFTIEYRREVYSG